ENGWVYPKRSRARPLRRFRGRPGGRVYPGRPPKGRQDRRRSHRDGAIPMSLATAAEATETITRKRPGRPPMAEAPAVRPRNLGWFLAHALGLTYRQIASNEGVDESTVRHAIADARTYRPSRSKAGVEADDDPGGDVAPSPFHRRNGRR